MDNKTKILIAFPLVLAIILIFVANRIPFGGGLSEAEIQMMEFTPSDLKIKDRQRIYISRVLKSPLDFSRSRIEQHAIKKDDLVPQIDYNDKSLSLIVISGGKRMAIIKGILVKEGDSVDGMKIARIEPDRVLLKDKTSQWLYLKKISRRQTSEGQFK